MMIMITLIYLLITFLKFIHIFLIWKNNYRAIYHEEEGEEEEQKDNNDDEKNLQPGKIYD